MRPPLGAVVLAAGASTRMGRPKALVRWRGRTFVEHAVQLAAVGEPIVVVTGAVVLPAACTAGATVVHNPDWRVGQMSSLQRGLAALPPECAALVLTVDRPHIAAATVNALVEAWARQPHLIWQPAHAGRRGHPMIYPADVAATLIAAAPTATQRGVLAGWAPRRRTLPTGDRAVLDNLDRPEDLVRLGDVEL